MKLEEARASYSLWRLQRANLVLWHLLISPRFALRMSLTTELGTRLETSVTIGPCNVVMNNISSSSTVCYDPWIAEANASVLARTLSMWVGFGLSRADYGQITRCAMCSYRGVLGFRWSRG